MSRQSPRKRALHSLPSTEVSTTSLVIDDEFDTKEYEHNTIDSILAISDSTLLDRIHAADPSHSLLDDDNNNNNTHTKVKTKDNTIQHNKNDSDNDDTIDYLILSPPDDLLCHMESGLDCLIGGLDHDIIDDIVDTPILVIKDDRSNTNATHDDDSSQQQQCHTPPLPPTRQTPRNSKQSSLIATSTATPTTTTPTITESSVVYPDITTPVPSSQSSMISVPSAGSSVSDLYSSTIRNNRSHDNDHHRTRQYSTPQHEPNASVSGNDKTFPESLHRGTTPAHNAHNNANTSSSTSEPALSNPTPRRSSRIAANSRANQPESEQRLPDINTPHDNHSNGVNPSHTGHSTPTFRPHIHPSFPQEPDDFHLSGPTIKHSHPVQTAILTKQSFQQPVLRSKRHTRSEAGPSPRRQVQ